MIQIFYTRPRIEGNCVRYREEISLRNYIDNMGEEIHSSRLHSHLLKELIINPKNKQLIRVWQCYLMNRCVIVVRKEYQRFSGYLIKYELAYLFDLTYDLLHCRFFEQEKYKFKIPSNFMIKDCFRKQIRKYLMPNFSITDRGVAVRSTRKRWLEVASNSLEIEQYSILCGCVKKSSQVNSPCNKWIDNDFQEIANEFNKLSQNKTPLTGENVKDILDFVGKKIRELVDNPPLISLDQSWFQQKKESPLIDVIPSPNNVVEDDTYLEEIQMLTQFINQILTNFETKQKEIAFYNFALKFGQIKTAKELGINQSTVSRLGTFIYQQIFHSFHPHNSQKIKPKPTSEQLQYLKESMRDFYDRKIQQLTLNNHSSEISNTDYIATQIQDNFHLESFTEIARSKLRELIREILQFYQKI